MSSTTFSGPVTSTAGFVGAVTGAVTGNVTGDVTGNVTGAVLAVTPVNVTAATLTVTQAAHAGRTVTINAAAGCAITLPAATGTGSVYEFFFGTTITSNSSTIKVVGDDTMSGSAILLQDAADTVVGFETAATDDTITFNGTTTGGLKGATVRLRDVTADLWAVDVRSAATGTEATPFSATV